MWMMLPIALRVKGFDALADLACHIGFSTGPTGGTCSGQAELPVPLPGLLWRIDLSSENTDSDAGM